ncbi:MAG: hypothetical protein GWN87_18585, partial [Desulfuromonadales bacterium]|nr:hypothetical protein [Desulfuromonadales bacterium]NIS42081.1 hypothetical protein [Desulfuromonadales bacterium]
IGFDLALAGLDPLQGSLLVSLDADTLVDSTYLPAIEKHFAGSDKGGAVLPFLHRCDGSCESRSAIETYELYLRAYPLGLHLAGSPYAYPTLGSAMACTAEAYVRAGGMNRRPAGEDFYFLQQLAKTGGVAQLYGTVVRPSARLSARTPFGTGPSMLRLTGGEEGVVAFHDPRVFEILGRWLRLAGCTPEAEARELLPRAASIHPELAAFLVAADFQSAWTRLRDNGRGAVNPERFHDWFDGLKTFRLVRHLSQQDFPPGEPTAMVAPLLRMAGLPEGETVSEQNRRLCAFWGADIAKRVV